MKTVRVSGIILLLLALGWSERGFGEPIPAPQGELHIVSKNPRTWIDVTYNVFEHLMELDQEGQLVPRLASRWRWPDDRNLEVTLRQPPVLSRTGVGGEELVNYRRLGPVGHGSVSTGERGLHA